MNRGHVQEEPYGADAFVCLPPEWSQGAQKIDIFEMYSVQKRESRFNLGIGGDRGLGGATAPKC